MVFRMKPIVCLITVVNAMTQRHRTIGGYRHAKDPLLQIRAMVLIVAEPEDFLSAPSGVLAAKSDRCGVLMDLSAVQFENLDGAKCQAKEHILVSPQIKVL